MATLKQAHAAEMEQARQRINELEQKFAKPEKPVEMPPKLVEVKVNNPTLEGSPSRRRKKDGRRQSREHPRTPSDVRKMSTPTLSVLTAAARPRSASLTDLTDQGTAGGVPETTNRSLEGSQQRVVGGATITELVAESLTSPGTMAAIRKELKADALTPKIQRKFAAKTTPPSLPSIGGTTETSPLAKECAKASPRPSRTDRNS